MKLKFLITTLLSLSAFIIAGNAQPQSEKLQNLSIDFTNCESNSIFSKFAILKKDGFLQCNSGESRKADNAINSNFVDNLFEKQAASNLQTAIDALGAKGGLLRITTPIDCTSKITEKQTENLILEFSNDGKIVYQPGCNLIIKSGIKADKTRIFSGFDKNNLRLNADVDYYYPEWFGAKGRYGVDDLAAIQLMFDACYYINDRGKIVGFRYKFGAKSYYLSGALHIPYLSIIEGAGGAGNGATTLLIFPPNAKGVIFESSLTQEDGKGGFLKTRNASEMSKISDVSIVALAGNTNIYTRSDVELPNWKPTHAVNLSGMTITNVTGGKLSGSPMMAYSGFPGGTTVTIGRSNWFLKDLGASAQINNVLQPYRSAACGYGKAPNQGVCSIGQPGDVIYILNGTVEPYWIGMKLRVVGSPTEYIIDSIPNPDNKKSEVTEFVKVKNLNGTPAKIADFSGDVEIYDFQAGNQENTNRPVRFNTFHGLEARAQIWVENVLVDGFNGNCFNFDSSQNSGEPGNQPNVNNSNMTRNFGRNCAGNGVYTRGTNANQINFYNNDMEVVAGSGFYETSFLGNIFVGNHSAYNSGGSYVQEGVMNSSNFLGNYSEGGQPCVFLQSQYAVWIGGNACFRFDSAGALVYSGGEGAVGLSKIAMTAPNGTRYYLSIDNDGNWVKKPY